MWGVDPESTREEGGIEVCNNWRPTTWEEVCKRAAGRCRYNACRRVRALCRRLEVCRRLGKYGMTDRGVQARIARELGVSRSTVCSDMRALIKRGR
jgi:hypothetical protein